MTTMNQIKQAPPARHEANKRFLPKTKADDGVPELLKLDPGPHILSIQVMMARTAEHTQTAMAINGFATLNFGFMPDS